MSKRVSFFLSFLLAVATTAHAARIKDVASVAGVRNNQLIGYGLVTGLPGTGESSPFTAQSFKATLQRFGIQMPDGVKPSSKNIAAVMVTANLPPFSKQGQQIDVTVASVGSAKSLRGGTLLRTFLTGLDGKVYAIAQGNLVVSGFSASGADGSKVMKDNPTVGLISGGAIIEREVPSPFSRGDYITFNLHESDFTTAQRMAESINSYVGPDQASAVDSTSVRVLAPRDVSARVSFLASIENLEFTTADSSGKIIVNSRTGTIVVGQHVHLKPAAVTHGGMTVAIKENQSTSQPNAMSNGQTALNNNSQIEVSEEEGKMFKFEPGTTLNDLVRAVNEVGAAPSDLMAILQALKQAGAIEGQLIII